MIASSHCGRLDWLELVAKPSSLGREVSVTASEVSKESVSSLQRYPKTSDGCSGFPLQYSWPDDRRSFRLCHLTWCRALMLAPTNTFIIRSSGDPSATPYRAWARTIRSSKCPVAALPATTRFGSPAGGSVPGCEDRTLPSAEGLQPPISMNQEAQAGHSLPKKKCPLTIERSEDEEDDA